MTLSRVGVRSNRRRVETAERALDAALRRAGPGGETAQHRLAALRRRVAADAVGLQQAIEEYGVIARGLIGIVRERDSQAPTLAMAKAADAHTAIVQAIDAADMERVTVALALLRGTENVRVRGTVVGAGALDAFRQTAARPLVGELNALEASPPASVVARAREVLVVDPADLRRQVPLRRWLPASDARIQAMLRLDRRTDGVFTSTAAAGIEAAEASARRTVVVSVGVLVLVVGLGLGLALRRSIARPLGELSAAARSLTAGEPASGSSYVGRDEIGEVAAAFRDLHVTADRLAGEIRAMNVAVEDSRLGHRADPAGLQGRWLELVEGMNDTMAAFAELQLRRERAERQADRIIDMSLDPICIADFDGYFKRVNPAFAELLGYPTETMLSLPTREFVHPDDRASRDARHARRDAGEQVRYEQRHVCSDGSFRRIEWSARFMPEERIVYGVGRDVTDRRRAAEEQAALRRVATLVAKGVPPAEIFAAVADEVGVLFEAGSAAVLRFEPDGSIAVLGAVPDGSGARHEDVAAAVAGTGSATRTDGAIAAPILVEDGLWGVVAVSEGAGSLPPGTEERLARFTELVATAIANAESRAEVAASRARVVAAGDEERRRVVRDLHDGGQQRLVHAIMTLELACGALAADDAEAPALVAEALEYARQANEQLRELSHGILPAALTRGGLRAGVDTLVARLPLTVASRVAVERLPAVHEATAYFIVAEALTNIAKHAQARRAEVSVDVDDGTVRIAVRDDGVGGARPDGSGLVGLRDRLEALGGRLRIDSRNGRGTLVAAEIPLSGEPVAKAVRAAGPSGSVRRSFPSS